MSDLDFYWTVASGSSRKAIRLAAGDADDLLTAYADSADIEIRDLPDFLRPDALPEPEYAMVSYATENNRPFEGPSWMIDSGGYSLLLGDPEFQTTVEDYLQYLVSYEDRIDRYALRDWPCEPDILRKWNRDVEDHQDLTIRDHIATLEAAERYGLDADPVAVLQGYDVREYLQFADRLRDRGLLTDHVGIGTVCRRGKSTEIRNIILKLREALSSRISLHGFGVKQEILKCPETLAALDTVDSAAWTLRNYHATKRGAEQNPARSPYWVSFDDQGTPRLKWENLLIAFRDYYEGLQERIDAAPKPKEVDIVGLTDFNYNEASSGPVFIQCPCGTLINPGRVRVNDDYDPTPGCRHCHRFLIDMAISQIGHREDYLLRANMDAPQMPETPADTAPATEQTTLPG